MHEISADTRNSLVHIERARFVASHPKSQALAAQAAPHWLFGVPLHWMSDWSTPFALQVASARGACVTDVDGHDYADFCLGDTGAMFGHAPPAVVSVVQQQVALGCTAMLPGADNRHVPGVAHVALAFHPRVMRESLAMLASAASSPRERTAS